MPAVSRSQLLAYAALTLLVVVLGARALRTERAATGPPPEAVIEGTGAAPTEPAGGAGALPRGRVATPGTGAGVAPARQDGDGSVSGAGAPAPTADVLVHVAGAVREPGVYRLGAGARVQDAVTRAGGARRGADLHRLNLAAKVTDGQQVLVPRRGTAPSPMAGPATEAGTAVRSGEVGASGGDGSGGGPPDGGGVVDVNTASVEELETLDGVGPAIAQKIVAWREANGGFRSVDDLAQVSGIGPKKLEAMRARVAV